jgi:hypothetical protein
MHEPGKKVNRKHMLVFFSANAYNVFSDSKGTPGMDGTGGPQPWNRKQIALLI